MDLLDRLKAHAQTLKKETAALYLAYHRPDLPMRARIAALLVVGYALSPIDLIPDFIPVLGYLDDLILLPVGIALTIRMIPEEIMTECRKEAETLLEGTVHGGRIAGALILGAWLLLIGWLVWKYIL